MANNKRGERQPLLSGGISNRKVSFNDRNMTDNRKISDRDITSLDMPQGALFYTTSGITMQKHLTLTRAIVIMIGSVAGTGIFISPTGVLQGTGSVGLTLILWAVCGLLNLLLALCYAELGSAIPVAGGDYAYIYKILGRFPAFMSLWVMVVIIGPSAMAFISRTFGMYLSALFDLDCSIALVISAAVFLLVTACLMNMFSISWSSRSATLLSVTKVIGMGLVIIIGMVKLAQGHTSNFHDIFKGSSTDPGSIVLAFLPGYVTYGGWDCINALAEEMKNPRRDLPIAAFVSLTSVIIIYLCINVAYFTMLSPQEFLLTDAVAMSFIRKACPQFAWIIPVLVCLSAVGSAMNSMMACPRWAFAGGRDGNLPKIFSFMHIRHFTPIPAVALMCSISIFFAVATFLDLQSLLKVSSLQMQIKTSLALIALLRLRHKTPEIPRTIEVPLILIVMGLVFLLVVIVVAVYQDPALNGIGFLVFLCGAPVYLLSLWLPTFSIVNKIMHKITAFLQRLMLVVPEKRAH